jgi:hypothetical protein
MSWFKRRPHVKTPPKAHAHHTSPASEKIRKERQDAIRGKTDKDQNSK